MLRKGASYNCLQKSFHPLDKERMNLGIGANLYVFLPLVDGKQDETAYPLEMRALSYHSILQVPLPSSSPVSIRRSKNTECFIQHPPSSVVHSDRERKDQQR